MAKSLAKKAVVGFSVVLFVGFIATMLLGFRILHIGNPQEDAVTVCEVAKDALAAGHDPLVAIEDLSPYYGTSRFYYLFDLYHLGTHEAVASFRVVPKDHWHIFLGSSILSAAGRIESDMKEVVKKSETWCPELRHYIEQQLADSAEDSSGSPG